MEGLFDPTFRTLQSDAMRPNSIGTVIASLGSDVYTVQFRGRQITATSAGKRPLAVGTSVTVAQVGSEFWVIDAAAGYPTRYARPLSDFAESNQASVFLALILADNPRVYDYREGTALGAASAYVLNVRCWDGEVRQLPVRYADADAGAAMFSDGDRVLCYRRTEATTGGIDVGQSADWEVVGTGGTVNASDAGTAWDGHTQWAISVYYLDETGALSGTHPDITVGLTYSGSAVQGVDYTGTASVTIPAGQSVAYAYVTPRWPMSSNGARSATMTIASTTYGAIAPAQKTATVAMPTFRVFSETDFGDLTPDPGWPAGVIASSVLAGDGAVDDPRSLWAGVACSLAWDVPDVLIEAGYTYVKPGQPDFAGTSSSTQTSAFAGGLGPTTSLPGTKPGDTGWYLKAGSYVRITVTS